MFHFSVFALKKNFLYFTKSSLFNNVCIYIVKRNFGGVKGKKCHKHSCNEKCGICWFLKKANNDKRNIFFFNFALTALCNQDVNTWQGQTL